MGFASESTHTDSGTGGFGTGRALSNTGSGASSPTGIGGPMKSAGGFAGAAGEAGGGPVPAAVAALAAGGVP